MAGVTQVERPEWFIFPGQGNFYLPDTPDSRQQTDS